MATGIVRPRGKQRYLSWATAKERGIWEHRNAWEVKPDVFIGAEGPVTQDEAERLLQEGEPVMMDSRYHYSLLTGRLRKGTAYKRMVTKPEYDRPDFWEEFQEYRARTKDASPEQKEYQGQLLEARFRNILNREKEEARRAAAEAKMVGKKGVAYIVNVSFEYEYERLNRAGEAIRRTDQQNITQEITPKEAMTEQEMLDEAIQGWLAERFSADSPVENLRVIGTNITRKEDANLRDVPLGSLKLFYKSFAGVKPSAHPDQCVIDYLLWEASKTDSRKKYGWTRTYLESQLGSGKTTTGKILEFAQEQGDVSVYAVDCMMQVFASHVAEKSRVCLCFMVNNGHCYPITEETARKQVAVADRLSLEDIRIGRWDIEKASYGGKVETCDAPVLVLDTDGLEHVAARVMNRTGHAIERMSWNDGSLVAFQHPTKALTVVAGREFENRRALCDKNAYKHK